MTLLQTCWPKSWLTSHNNFFTAYKNGVLLISNLLTWVFIFLSWTGVDIFLPQFWSTLNVLTSANLPKLTQTMYELSVFGYERTEYERSMGTTALETNNAFWVITQTYCNSGHLSVFCIVKSSKPLKWKRCLNFIANLQSVSLISLITVSLSDITKNYGWHYSCFWWNDIRPDNLWATWPVIKYLISAYLPPKLNRYGIDDSILFWFSHFLKSRQQTVVICGAYTITQLVNWKNKSTSGSIIGPILFFTYVNEIPNIVTSSIKLFTNDNITTNLWQWNISAAVGPGLFR